MPMTVPVPYLSMNLLTASVYVNSAGSTGS